MKLNSKTMWVLMMALVFAGIYSCQNCHDSFKGTVVKIGKTSILIPRSYRMVKHDSTGMLFVNSQDSTGGSNEGGGNIPPLSSPQTITDSNDSITINPGGKGAATSGPGTTTTFTPTPTPTTTH